MKAKNILMICLFISGLFCLPSKAQQPGENVSSQTIRKLGYECRIKENAALSARDITLEKVNLL